MIVRNIKSVFVIVIAAIVVVFLAAGSLHMPNTAYAQAVCIINANFSPNPSAVPGSSLITWNSLLVTTNGGNLRAWFTDGCGFVGGNTTQPPDGSYLWNATCNLGATVHFRGNEGTVYACARDVALGVIPSSQVGPITVNAPANVTWLLTGAGTYQGTGNQVISGAPFGTYTLTVRNHGGNNITTVTPVTQALGGSCPVGQTNPHGVCSGSTCQSIAGCGNNSCTGNLQCGGGGGGGGGCFVPGTPVMTPQGERAIETIKVGDLVVAYDTEHSRSLVSPVTEVEATGTSMLTHIELSDMAEITATPVHRFWTERGWVAGGHLKVDDRLLKKDGAWMLINNIWHEQLTQPTTVYNLHIKDDAHNFYAGGVLVHNIKVVETFDPRALLAGLGVKSAQAQAGSISFTISSRPAQFINGFSLSPPSHSDYVTWRADINGGSANAFIPVVLWKQYMRTSDGATFSDFNTPTYPPSLANWFWGASDASGYSNAGTPRTYYCLGYAIPGFDNENSDHTDNAWVTWDRSNPPPGGTDAPYSVGDWSNSILHFKPCGANMQVITTDDLGNVVPAPWTVSGPHSTWNQSQARVAATAVPGTGERYTFRADRGIQSLTVGAIPPGYGSYTAYYDTGGGPVACVACSLTLVGHPDPPPPAGNPVGTFRIVFHVAGGPQLPIVDTLPATLVTTNSALLHGTVNPNGFATTEWFRHGTTTPPGTVSPSGAIGSGNSPVAVSYSLTGLTAGTRYYFRAVGQNSNGSTLGPILFFDTLSLPPVCPQAPTLTVSPPSASVTVGSTTSFVASYDSDGAACITASAPVSAVWTSSNALIAASIAPPGTYRGVSPGSITVTATYLGTSGSASLNVNSIASPDFTCAAIPSIFSIKQGDTAIGNFRCSAVNGFTGAISLSTSGVPAGATASFGSPSISIPPDPTQTAYTFNTGTIMVGTYTFNIRATSGAISKTYTVTVTVNPPECVSQPFGWGSVSTPIVAPGGQYYMDCEYGVNTNAIFPQPGSGSCVFRGWVGVSTIAEFDCTAGLTPGTYSNNCTMGNIPPDNFCARTDLIGSITVSVPPVSHRECVNQACANVSGAGANRCSINNDCFNPSIRSVCDPVQLACVNRFGIAPSTCSADPACGGPGPTHLECQNGNSCVVVSGVGPNTCANVGACTHLDCVAGACAVVAGGGLNGGGCSSAGPACGPTHSACDSSTNTCAVFAGAGADLDGCNSINAGSVCAPSLLPTCSIVAVPSTIFRGQSTVVAWGCGGPVPSPPPPPCTLTQGTSTSLVSSFGSVTVSPTSRTAYSISCPGSPAPPPASVSVIVLRRGEVIPR